MLLVAVHTPGFEAGWGTTTRVLTLLPSATVAELFDGTAMPPPSDSRGVLPLFAEHLLRFARDGGTDPPARLVDLLGQRLEHVSSEGRRALQVVAVLGEPVRAEDIEPLLDDKTTVGPVLAKLAQRGLITLDESGAAQVAHPLLREVVMAMIPVAARHDLHAAAQQRAQRKGHPTEVQALYAALAGDSFQALLLLDHVAAQAHRRGDSEGSTLALRRALEVARQELFRGELDDPAEAVVLFSIKLADALCQQGNFTDADGVLREALDLATPSGVDRAKVLRGLAQVARGRSREGEAVGYLRKAIEIAHRTGERELARSLESLR
ncbi:MAG: tetratricopeptide repeat protein [Myxococcales bacterium]|nr:MAG: tetratricopeptide repeat protein [Myxococcales bacterium]